ncbi:MAG: hypothetical protein CO128_06220, partial [Ignavibacteriales bacterium CG_4_9_14_3_um_filter_30_11]
MNHLHKLFLTATWLLFLYVFTSTSFAQSPSDGAANVSITTTYDVPAGLAGAPLSDGTAYDLYVLNATGNTIVGAKYDFNYNNGAGNTGPSVALINYQDYQWGVWTDGANPTSVVALYGPFTFTTIGPTITLTGGTVSIAENSGTAILTATASAAIGKDLDVIIAYTGTSTFITDYTNTGAANPEPITILSIGTTGTTTITGVADLLFEGDETVIGTISPSATYVVGGSAQTVTIIDAERISLIRSTSQVDEGAAVSYFAEVRDDGGGSINGATVANGNVT